MTMSTIAAPQDASLSPTLNVTGWDPDHQLPQIRQVRCGPIPGGMS